MEQSMLTSLALLAVPIGAAVLARLSVVGIAHWVGSRQTSVASESRAMVLAESYSMALRSVQALHESALHAMDDSTKHSSDNRNVHPDTD